MKRFWLSFALALGACGPGSIDHLCEEAAIAQCARCYACEIDGATLCGVGAETSEDACVEAIVFGCGDQSATVEEPKKRLQECVSSLETLSCEQLVASHAQGGRSSTVECEYFL